jgi:NitT/TauT family transport system substrate-binding protein
MPSFRTVTVSTLSLLLIALSGCGSASPTSAAPASAKASATTANGAPASPASAKPSSAAASDTPASAAASAIPSISAGQTVSITTATGVPSAVFTPVWIAIDKGYFKEHGLDVKLQQIEGVTQAQAIIAGQVPIGNVGGTEVLDSRVGGADLIAILQGTDSPVFEIHAPKATTNIDDLKGKTIAITRVGSSTDLATRVILQNHGLTAGQDVKLLAVNNMPGILAAMETGQVQAGTMSPPTTAKANAAGFPKLVSALDEHVPLQQGLLVTTKKYADAHPEVVYAYLQAYYDGLRDFFNNPNLAISTIAKYTKSDQPTAKEAYEAMKPAMDPVGVVDPRGFKTVQKYGHNTKTRQLNVADAYDNQFVQALQGSGYIAKLGIKSK